METKNRLKFSCSLTILFLTGACTLFVCSPIFGQKHIGQVVGTCEMSPAIEDIVGMDFQDNDGGRFLYVFEGKSGKLHKCVIDEETGNFACQDYIMIEGVELSNPRGLAYARENSGDVVYFMDYVSFQQNGTTTKKGLLYRYDISAHDLTHVDLNATAYEIGTNPVFGVTKQGGNLYVSYNPSSFLSHTMRVRRGITVISVSDDKSVAVEKNGKSIVRPYEWEEALAGRPVIKKQIAGPGKAVSGGEVEPCRALTSMTTGGTDYLWGTVGNDYIYLLDGETGRGIFFFERPKSATYPFYDLMAYWNGYLWVSEKISQGRCVMYQVNVLDNLLLPYAGPKCFREMRMQITSTVNQQVTTPRGFVYHTFCHPYSSDITGNQGVIPNSVRVNDLTGVPDFNIEHLYLDPAGDSCTRQYFTLVSYLADQYPDIRQYKTEFFIKFWTREYRHFIYPHLTVKDGGPEGTYYLDDDEIIYGINAVPGTYDDFITRVKEAIGEEYGIEPDMNNPYWASRSILEYVKENYHYPNDDAGYWATYDFDKGHYNSHPGNLKAALSADDSFDDNIIACSGTGAMVGGALRFIGIPSIWLGTSKEVSLSGGYLGSAHNEAEVSNGHRYNKVWLGEFYGWQDLDATPAVPADNAFNIKPKELSQWDIMQGTFSKVSPKRLIHNLQSEFWDKMHVPFRGTCEKNVNTCGSVRYNLLGSYTNPVQFNLSGQFMRIRGIQYIENINVDISSESLATISWQKTGDWEPDTAARFTLVLDKQCSYNESCFPGYERMGVLATDIPYDQEVFTMDMSSYEEGYYRIIISKVNDPFTGNEKTFLLEHTLGTFQEKETDEHVEVYPNPTTGQLFIAGKNINKVEICDCTGRAVYCKNDGDLGNILLGREMNKGLYIVKVYTTKGMSVRRIILH